MSQILQYTRPHTPTEPTPPSIPPPNPAPPCPEHPHGLPRRHQTPTFCGYAAHSTHKPPPHQQPLCTGASSLHRETPSQKHATQPPLPAIPPHPPPQGHATTHLSQACYEDDTLPEGCTDGHDTHDAMSLAPQAAPTDSIGGHKGAGHFGGQQKSNQSPANINH